MLTLFTDFWFTSVLRLGDLYSSTFVLTSSPQKKYFRHEMSDSASLYNLINKLKNKEIWWLLILRASAMNKLLRSQNLVWTVERRLSKSSPKCPRSPSRARTFFFNLDGTRTLQWRQSLCNANGVLLDLQTKYLANRFHVAVRLFSNRSQMTSKMRRRLIPSRNGLQKTKCLLI